MEVNFFNQPYVLYEDGLPSKMPPDIRITNEYCVGFTYSKKHSLSFPVFIYNCLYEYEKDWV